MTVPNSKPKWRPRFSLRSLILAVLLVGSGFGPWRSWHPWVPVANMIHEEAKILTVSSECRLIASVAYGDTFTLRIWDLSTGEAVSSIDLGNEAIRSAHFSEDGKRLVTLGENPEMKMMVCIWEVTSGKELLRIRDLPSSHAPIFTPSGDRLVVCHGSHPGFMWDATTGKEIWAKRSSYYEQPGYKELEKKIQEERTKEQLNGEAAETIEGFMKALSKVWVYSRVSPNGGKMATWIQAGKDSAKGQLWDLTSGRKTCDLNFHCNVIELDQTFFDATGERFFARYDVRWDPSLKIHVWDTGSGNEIAELLGQVIGDFTPYFSPNGRLMLTVERGGYSENKQGVIRIFDLKERRMVSLLDTGGIDPLAISPDIMHFAVFDFEHKKVVFALAQDKPDKFRRKLPHTLPVTFGDFPQRPTTEKRDLC